MASDKRATKTQQELITVTNGTTSGIYSKEISLDTSFNRCNGIQVVPITTGGTSYYSVGIKDNDRTYHDLAHQKTYESGTGVPPNERFLKTDIRIKSGGEKLTIETKIPATLTADLTYQIIFRLENSTEDA